MSNLSLDKNDNFQQHLKKRREETMDDKLMYIPKKN